MVSVVEPPEGRFPVHPRVVGDLHEPVQVAATLAEHETEAAVAGLAVLCAETLHAGLHVAPVLDSSVETHGALNGMRKKRLVVFEADWKVVEQVRPVIEQRGDAFGSEQLRVGLALDEKSLHLRQLQVGKVRQRQHAERQQQQLRAQSGAPEPGADLHVTDQR